MSQDLETSPLLGNPPTVEAADANIPAAAQQYRVPNGRRIKWLIILILLGCLTSMIFFGVYAFRGLPSQDVIEESVIKVSNWQIDKVHIDGWRTGDHLDTEGGDALQLSVQARYWPDYEPWIQDNTTSLELRDKTFYKSLSEKFVRTMCLTINNATTYDGLQIKNNTVGTLQVKNQFCLDLHNNVTTPLNLTILIEPRMENILRVLKKLWLHEYDKLDLSSILDVSLTRRAGKSNSRWGLPLGRLHGVQINWKKFLNWGFVSKEIHRLRHHFDDIAVQDFSLRDSANGFLLEASAEPLTLPPIFDWVEMPKGSIVPSIDWDIRLPDCKNEFSIGLPNVSCVTNCLKFSETINVTATTDIEGPLPSQLLSQVCWSDEENALTPMTMLLNKVLNSSELVTVEIRGHSAGPGKVPDNSVVPCHILDTFFRELSFFPITTNVTVEADNLIQGVTIDKLKARWVRSLFGEKKLSVSGTIVGTVALPFYETSKEVLSVDYIKGETKLYHQDVNFLDIPMRYWTKSNSRIYKDDQDNKTMMELTLSVRDDEVQVVNNFELTKVFNEVLFKGESPVHLESKLDIMISSPLGAMVLMGLSGDGNTTLRS